MKLYVLFNKNGDVVAHTRDEDLFKKYYFSLKKQANKFPRIVKDKKAIEDIEKTFFKKVIWEEDVVGETVTEDTKPLFDFAKEEFDKLTILNKDLSNIIENYNIPKSDKKELRRALSILKELGKKKNFKKATGVDLVADIVKNNPGVNLFRIFNIGDR